MIIDDLSYLVDKRIRRYESSDLYDMFEYNLMDDVKSYKGSFISYDIKWTVFYENLEATKYILFHKKIEKFDGGDQDYKIKGYLTYIFRVACIFGSIKTLDWLNSFGFRCQMNTYADILKEMIEDEYDQNIETFEWLSKHKYFCETTTVLICAKSDNIRNWIFENSLSPLTDTYVSIADTKDNLLLWKIGAEDYKINYNEDGQFRNYIDYQRWLRKKIPYNNNTAIATLLLESRHNSNKLIALSKIIDY